MNANFSSDLTPFLIIMIRGGQPNIGGEAQPNIGGGGSPQKI